MTIIAAEEKTANCIDSASRVLRRRSRATWNFLGLQINCPVATEAAVALPANPESFFFRSSKSNLAM